MVITFLALLFLALLLLARLLMTLDHVSWLCSQRQPPKSPRSLKMEHIDFDLIREELQHRITALEQSYIDTAVAEVLLGTKLQNQSNSSSDSRFLQVPQERFGGDIERSPYVRRRAHQLVGGIDIARKRQ